MSGSASWVDKSTQTRYFIQPNKEYYNTGKSGPSDIQRVDGSLYLRAAAPIESSVSPYSHFEKYIVTTNGLYQFTKGTLQTMGAAIEVFKPTGEAAKILDGAKGFLGAGKSFLILPRIANTVASVAQLNSNSDWLDRIHDWVEMVGSIITGWMIVAPIFGKTAPGAEIASPICDLVSDGIEAGKNTKKIVDHTKLINKMEADNADPALVNNAKDERNVSIFKTIKGVAAVSIAVFALLALALGAPVVPAIVLLIVGLVQTVFTITAHFYERTRATNLTKENYVADPEVLRSAKLLPRWQDMMSSASSMASATA
ncbi:MAG: hypothetical protein JSS32_02080 [Verrucomicrobia bacterium]|nr:hypothetical protein [Verrucomicrobiota bacterium]